MEFFKIKALPGPNPRAPVPIIEAHVDCRNLRDQNNSRSHFRQRWQEWLPVIESLAKQQRRGLIEASFSVGPSLYGRLGQVVAANSPIAEVVEVAARVLESAVGVAAQFGETQETDEPHVYVLAVQFEEESLGRACLDTALAMCVAAAREEPFDLPAAVRLLIDLADDVRLGPSTRAIVRAATARGIPFRRMNAGSLVQLGEGARQRRIWTAETDSTSVIGENIAQDKELTKRLLGAVGVPVPQGRPVSSADDAWVAAGEIGTPVVVKPRQANHSRGISLDLHTREEVLAAHEWAASEAEGTGVIVEQFAPGRQYRLLVVGDRLIAAARGESEYIVGDGVHTIQQLVAEVNLDPRRGENYTDVLDVLKLNRPAMIELRKQGFTPGSVPTAGQRVLIQHIGDLTTDCTADVHPSNAAKVVLAAKVIGLDVAGIDLIAEDVSRPFAEQRAAILEVNAGPSLSAHVAPLHGQAQPVGEAIVDLLFPPGQNGTIPVIAVTGHGDRAGVVRQIETLLRRAGRRVGSATCDGVCFDGQRLDDGRNDAHNIQSLLFHPYADVAVFESRPEQASSEGLGCPRVDVAVVTSLPELRGSSDDEGNRGVLAVVRAVPESGTIILPTSAASCQSSTILNSCRGTRIYFGPQAPDVPLPPNSQALFVRGQSWVLAGANGEIERSFTEGTGLSEAASPLLLAALAAVWGDAKARS